MSSNNYFPTHTPHRENLSDVYISGSNLSTSLNPSLKQNDTWTETLLLSKDSLASDIEYELHTFQVPPPKATMLTLSNNV